MNVLIPPTIMFTLTHPDAAETASEGRPIGRVERYRGLRWWTSQKSKNTVISKDAEPEKSCSACSARSPVLQTSG